MVNKKVNQWKPELLILKLLITSTTISKNWFVYFRYYHNNKWNLKILKGSINKCKTKTERLKQAENLRTAIEIKLKREEWNPFGDDGPKNSRDKQICLVLDEIMETKKSSMKPKSIRSYNDIVNMFKKWIESNNYTYLFP